MVKEKAKLTLLVLDFVFSLCLLFRGKITLRAARHLGREQDMAIVGQGADRLLLEEIRQSGSRVIESTAYMSERYGEQLLALALKILRRVIVPPAVYTQHVFLNADNINAYYPQI